MPVQAIPLAPFMKTFSNSNAHGHAASASVSSAKALEAAVEEATVDSSSRTATPHNLSRSSTPVPHVPTTELAAKAAIMNSRLEGIRSLFSIEVALKLVHLAKGSLERAAQFAMVEGQTGEEAYARPSPCPLTSLLTLLTLPQKRAMRSHLHHPPPRPWHLTHQSWLRQSPRPSHRLQPPRRLPQHSRRRPPSCLSRAR